MPESTKFVKNDPRLLGNKFGVGANSGRPRTTSPTPEECIELGEDLVKWATEPTQKNDWRCLFQQWYSIKMGILRKDWKSLIQKPEFVPYYEMAQAALSVKCVNGTMKDGFGQRYIRLYDRDLVEAENEQAKIDAELRKQSDADQHQKVIFEVNYKNDANDTVSISPSPLSTSDSPSPK